MFRQSQPQPTAGVCQQGRSRGRGAVLGCGLSTARALGLGSARFLPGESQVRISPPPPAPPAPQCCVGRHLPDPQGQWAGEGAGASGAQQRAGPMATDSKTVIAPPEAAALPPDSVSPALGSPQSRTLLSWRNFPSVPSILISSSLGGSSCCSGGSRRAMPSSSGRSCHGAADRGRATPRLQAPNFPHLGPTLLASPSAPLAKP